MKYKALLPAVLLFCGCASREHEIEVMACTTIRRPTVEYLAPGVRHILSVDKRYNVSLSPNSAGYKADLLIHVEEAGDYVAFVDAEEPHVTVYVSGSYEDHSEPWPRGPDDFKCAEVKQRRVFRVSGAIKTPTHVNLEVYRSVESQISIVVGKL
ncbi:hypothetical protein [Archangium sp. Cb G35]|uniref:hypothetical protein n=1 Tax=Archangium sp. Cb G35 TaxID=1920190 RepID=UPI001160F0F0|nr:hypothetical protein [Archangium sp. Cb G35]